MVVMISSYWGVWGDVPNHLVRLALAFLFALPVGWNRERQARSAGLRTFPIVAIASCGFVILAIEILGERSTAQARVLEGLITGIGFIGGGAILKAERAVHGTATAASIWNVGVVGAAVGFGYYDLGLILALTNFLVLTVLTPLKDNPGEPSKNEAGPPDAGTRSARTPEVPP
ncbi:MULTISPECIES: MgtC/SapB family protein [Bradyrhizobium]|jgi:putative Mg2+ transporter-C (MgtC) family protein|nr:MULTISPECIES: MgtC/SapB family protein [Bradyrhizobium]MDU0961009.1 MgtC/SapB family protein [Bradyrhizobium sp.]MDU1497256.1 MgtC/SapB family protein [Bradyrhizobium sp.]MDU1546601.1 MgtC/SapB family protein [Bradyrhizobium sp.]MDU1666955.1 MgtC/SapB family protein [Bradyrhizobium sp.]MDU1804099.1 MgtC/SapB family protein [Bradyrhizobium sp.]